MSEGDPIAETTIQMIMEKKGLSYQEAKNELYQKMDEMTPEESKGVVNLGGKKYVPSKTPKKTG